MPRQTPPNSQRKLCRAMHSFEARSKYELSVERDDLLDLLDDSQSWWKVRNNYGLFRYKFLSFFFYFTKCML